MKHKPNLILASASPRRRRMLADLGCEFSSVVADVDESVLAGELPSDYVQRVAQCKARAVHENHPQSAILAADTIVTQGTTIFGKPHDRAHAVQMWQQLSGVEHQVITAICLQYRANLDIIAVNTSVVFSEIDAAMMQHYWQSGEPQDKAGAYGIQGLASAWVQQIHGSYSNVVGLPLYETNQLLRSVGHNWL